MKDIFLQRPYRNKKVRDERLKSVEAIKKEMEFFRSLRQKENKPVAAPKLPVKVLPAIAEELDNAGV